MIIKVEEKKVGGPPGAWRREKQVRKKVDKRKHGNKGL
jgi:hypothetical protein